MSVSQTVNEKVLPVVMKFINLKAMQALKDGILFTLPLNIIGSIFLLIPEFPIQAFKDLCANTFGAGWGDLFYKVKDSTMGMMGLVAVLGIAYVYCKNEGVEPMSGALMAMCSYFVITNNWISYQPSKDDPSTVYQVSGVVPTTWLGAQGMICAIIVGLVVAWVYSSMIKKDIKLKMPEGVPEGVTNGFAALIPGAVVFTGSAIIYAIFKFGFNTSFGEVIYKIVQTPLQGATDSAVGAFVIALFVPLLWFFGIHGGATVDGVVGSLLYANTADNAALQVAGNLDLASGAHIVVRQFYDNFINLAGSGETLGLTFMMFLIAKSAQYRELGKLAIVPNVFNINEPVLFGTPIVMNPIMAVPFIIVPPINALILYFTIASGIIPPMGGVMAPWTVPPVISGFIIGGVPYMIMQIVVLAVSTAIYFPFFKKADAMAYADELAAQNAGEGVQP